MLYQPDARTPMLASTTCHLMHNVIPAAVDYGAAEGRLSEAYDAHPNNPDTWVDSARAAKRKAAELAIAIDGLTACAVQEINRSKCSIRADVSALCFFPGTTSLRCDALERVRGIANAYKHQDISDPTLLITSDADVLVVELGYGVEGFGVGKLGGVAVIARDKAGQSWKFMGDAPAAIGGWLRFLKAEGDTVPGGPIQVFGLQVYPGPSD